MGLLDQTFSKTRDILSILTLRGARNVDRVTYVIGGLCLFALKFNIDRCVATYCFHKQFDVSNYFRLDEKFTSLLHDPNERNYYSTLILLAIPFLWAGVMLTIGRLRSAALPVWLFKFFFVPLVNLAFFLILCCYPDREAREGDFRLKRESSQSGATRLLTAMWLPVPFALFLVYFCVQVLQTYGTSIFVGLPFLLGFVAALLFGRSTGITRWHLAGLGSASVFCFGFVLFLSAFEGIFCLAMAAPIGLTLGALGGLLAFDFLMPPAENSPMKAYLLILAMIASPVWIAVEYFNLPSAQVFAVTSSVEIKAPRQKVWKNVVEFSELPKPNDPILQAGIAYPLRATIDGRGVGAVRHCVFTTGEFVEPITVWREPALLKFDVAAQPKAMRELVFGPDIEPPHLEHYLVSKGGQFELIATSPTTTKLVGTTWYQHHMYPAGYWQLWSDFILHRIHLRVLNHIKSLSECS